MNDAERNEAIWDELSRKGVLCSRPKTGLTPATARQYLNLRGDYAGDLAGKRVLCLACGGGQQSIAFALLGARVTVVDFSAAQLEQDARTARAYRQSIRLIKSDMRDLSACGDAEFDLVYQPYSINYVPDVAAVFDGVARVTKPGGHYDLMFHNPFVHGSWKDGCWGSAWQPEELWEGRGYPLWQPYRDGYPIRTADPHWNFTNERAEPVTVSSPQEFRHTLSAVVNGIIGRGFTVLALTEEVGQHPDSPPGTWEHYKSCAPPWLYLLTRRTSHE